jgi:serine/threonine-protein kinase
LLPANRTVLLENWTIPPNELARDLAPYRAPERARGGPPTAATSVYALGILAWEAFVGHRPAEQPMVGAMQDELPSISQSRPSIFSPELDRIVAQAVAIDPNMRYASPIDFGRALDHYADASTGQTGRLATLPNITGLYAAPQPALQAAPSPQPQRRSFRRPQATSVAPVVAPPPPPHVLTELPTRMVTAPPPQNDQRTVDKQIKREVRREVRRQGCQRAIIKRSLQFLFVFLLLYGMYFGVSFAYDYVTGRLSQINPTDWVTSRLPNPSDFIPSWLRDSDLTATYRVTRPVNLRSAAGASSSETIVKVLDVGVRLQQIGPPQPDPDGQPYSWIRVLVLSDGTQGWVANQETSLEKQ